MSQQNNNQSNQLYPWLAGIYDDILLRIATQQLHHGLLFVADEGVGELYLLEAIAKSLLCEKVAHQPISTSDQVRESCGNCKSCLLFDAHSHPDLKKILSDKPSIGVDSIRNANEFVTTTSQLLGNKVVIIDDIHLMTEAASNSLLKTLEEPSNNTYILLSTNQPAKLLATIKSRCEKIRISLPDESDSIDWLKKQINEQVNGQSIDGASANLAGLRAYSGSPINYLQALQSDTLHFASFSEDLMSLSQQKVSAISLASKWLDNSALVLRWTYQWCKNEYQNAVLNKASTSNLLELEDMINKCTQANRKISQAGVNKTLLLQQIFNAISQKGA
jgi:DNA polymerase-3 subunit delta'